MRIPRKNEILKIPAIILGRQRKNRPIIQENPMRYPEKTYILSLPGDVIR